MALAAERYQPHQQRRPRAQVACPLPAPAAWAPPDKDYSQPLHVDCSVEYELPDCAKPPQGVKVEPLLMIHPAHFRRLDSLRRCPFINNLPSASGQFDLPPPPERRPCRPRMAKPPPACCVVNPYAPEPQQLICSAAEPYAPKEGDTLENSSFGRAARGRQRMRAHPYAPPDNCDKTMTMTTFDAIQGTPLISPFHAKMFTTTAESGGVYQNYPIVMYK